MRPTIRPSFSTPGATSAASPRSPTEIWPRLTMEASGFADGILKLNRSSPSRMSLSRISAVEARNPFTSMMGAGAGRQPVWIDDPDIAIGRERAEEDRFSGAGHTVDGDGARAGLHELGRLAGPDGEIVPMQDRPVGGLVDGDVARPLAADRGAAADHRAAGRIADGRDGAEQGRADQGVRPRTEPGCSTRCCRDSAGATAIASCCPESAARLRCVVRPSWYRPSCFPPPTKLLACSFVIQILVRPCHTAVAAFATRSILRAAPQNCPVTRKK